MFGRYTMNGWADAALRLLLTLLAGIVLFHPNDIVAISVSPLVMIGVILGILRHRVISPPAKLVGAGQNGENGETDPAALEKLVQEVKGEY